VARPARTPAGVVVISNPVRSAGCHTAYPLSLLAYGAASPYAVSASQTL